MHAPVVYGSARALGKKAVIFILSWKSTLFTMRLKQLFRSLSQCKSDLPLSFASPAAGVSFFSPNFMMQPTSRLHRIKQHFSAALCIVQGPMRTWKARCNIPHAAMVWSASSHNRHACLFICSQRAGQHPLALIDCIDRSSGAWFRCFGKSRSSFWVEPGFNSI